MIEKWMWALSVNTIAVKDQTYSECKFECLIYYEGLSIEPMNLGVENKNENWDWIKVQAFDWCDNWVALFIDLDTKFMKVQ
jgi:hypothetical protein